MRSRVTNKKQRGRRLITALATLSLVTGTFVLGNAVLASTPAGLFELEGDATSASEPAATPPDDWDRVCHEILGTDCSTSNDTNGATAVSWADDAAVVTDVCAGGTNCTIFTGGGSKDPIDINQWAWKTDSGGLPDKDNLQHGFAARYSIPSSPTCPGAGGDTTGATTCEMLFFGNDRFDNSGDAQQGFWFFQNAIGLGTNAVGGGSGFTSSNAPEFHRNGDLLLISDFTNGGEVSTITVYTWDTSCLKGVVKPAPGDCGDANLRLQATSTAANCNPADPALSGFCGIVNPSDGTVAPWSFTDKDGNSTYLNGEFYEGGVNLSTLGLGAECFASVASETRSSQSTTATLKDFVLGGFGECTSGVVTTPQTGAGGAITDTNSNGVPDLSIGTAGAVTVRDHAVVTVTGIATWTGDVAFSLCGPLALGSTTNCQTGGVSIPPSVAVSNLSTTANSAVTTLTSVGRYCWRADFTSPTSGVPDSSDPADATSVTECFEVLPVQPTLTTQASGDVALGSPISDTATISGTAKQPGTNGIGPGGTINATNGALAGGSITWTAFGPNNCTTVALASTSRTISGDGVYPTGAQTAVSFTPTAIGTYTFVASYGGNSPNTLSIGDTACPDTSGAEDVVVTGTAGLTTAQDWLPNDTATLTGPVNLNGTLTFTLYTGNNCGATSGTAVAGQQYIVTVTNAPTGSTFSTSNTTFKVTATASFSWLVHYDDTTLNDPADKCETTSLTITN